MFYEEARELYAKVNAQANKIVSNCQKVAANPYLTQMDQKVDEATVVEKVDLGIVEIPVRQIIGVTSTCPDIEYTYDFKPLAQTDSEFAENWCQLYLDYLSVRGLLEPIVCIEHLGHFYVVDGKKRVSVLKAHGESRVLAQVIRWLPESSGESTVKQYYEFLKYYQKAGLYQVFLSDAKDYGYLQKEMGLAPEQVWTEMDRFHFLFTFLGVERVHFALLGEYTAVTAADTFVALLKKYGFSQVSQMQPWDLEIAIPEALYLTSDKTVA